MKHLGRMLLGAWAIASIGALGHFLHVGGSRDPEFTVQLLWWTYLLNFPASALAAFVAGGGPILQWCWLTLAGFLQWGVAIPAALEFSKRRWREIGSERR